jgi:hypothetical protein
MEMESSGNIPHTPEIISRSSDAAGIVTKEEKTARMKTKKSVKHSQKVKTALL